MAGGSPNGASTCYRARSGLEVNELGEFRMRDIGAVDATEGKMMSLREIASWPPFSGSVSELPSVVAGVPSLQRGLVWRAGQVELMWDSLARGFPIGSLVVRPKLAGVQATHGIS